MADYAPDRGDLVWLSFDPRVGHEQSGRRPAFTISPRSYNETTGLALFCPVTSRVKGYPFEAPLPPGCAVSGVILSDQVKSLDWRARSAILICRCPEQATEGVLARLGALIE